MTIERLIPLAKDRTMKRRLSTSLVTAAMIALPLALAPVTATLHAQSVSSPARTVTPPTRPAKTTISSGHR